MSGGTMIAWVIDFIDNGFEWAAAIFFGVLIVTALAQWIIFCWKWIKEILNKKD